MYSEEHKKYLSNIRRNKYIVRGIQVIILISFIIIWQILADKEIINTFISSSPKKILEMILLEI